MSVIVWIFTITIMQMYSDC